MFKNLNLEVLGISGRESEVIELALSHGFKGIDLDLVDLGEQVESQGLAKATRLLKSARLKIGSFRLPVRWQDDETYKADLEKLAKLAPIAAELGATRSTTWIEPGSERRPFHENYEFHRRRLAELGDALKAHKISLAVGFQAPAACRDPSMLQFVQTVDQMLLLLRSVVSSNVGLALDSWHWHVGGGTIEQLAAISDKILTVTLADAEAGLTAADAQLSARRLPGDGVIDNAAILAQLAQAKFEGPVTPAPDQSQLAGFSREKCVKSCAAALDAVWKAAGLNPTGRLVPVPGR